MNFLTSVITCFKKYDVSKGRATRSEFWYFVFFICVGYMFLVAVGKSLPLIGIDENGPTIIFLLLLMMLFLLAVFFPFLSVSARRLHDINHSGWWILLYFLVPFLGVIILLIWFCIPGTQGHNRFGPNPFAIEPLPEKILCPNCSKMLTLTENERIALKFKCPFCEKSFEIED